MKNFRDVVTNFTIGAIGKSKVGFYAKRLTKETATRRLASALMIGLLVFQFVTFIAPPQRSSAAGTDIKPGGFSSIGQLLQQYDANEGHIHEIMDSIGVNREDLETASSPGWSCVPGLLSMGNGGTGTPSVNGTTVGDCSVRWGQSFIGGIKINRKIYADIGFGARWYEVGILNSCDNPVFLPTTEPDRPVQSVACQALIMTVASGQPVMAGTPIGVFGQAQGQNITDPGYKVTMIYDYYVDDPDPSKRFPGPAQDSGPLVPHNDAGLFQDTGNFPDVDNGPLLHSFVIDNPGNYIFRLVVKDPDGNAVEGSATGGCAVPVTVTAKPANKSLVCLGLDIVAKTGQADFAPGLKGTAGVVGQAGAAPYPAQFTYILLTKFTGTPPPGAPIVNYQGTNYLEGNPTGGTTRITHANANPAVYTDPAAPTPAFFATEFTQNSPGDFLVILRVQDQNGVTAPENVNCYTPFNVTAKPSNFSCKGLQATPSNGPAPLQNVVLTAQAGVNNATVQSYQFDFGDGNKQTVTTSALTATTAKHTYQNPANYTATVTIVTDKGTTNPNSCKTTITATPPIFVCKTLSASPATGGIPLDVNFSASVTVANATVQSFEFDFGDGAKQSVGTNLTTATAKHTYTVPGKYTASVVIKTDKGTTPLITACKVPINPTDMRFTKTVSNLTLLTTDGKPTDANGQVAKAGDTLRYQIAVCNASGAVQKAFVFEDDVTNLLYYAELADLGGATKVVTNGQTHLVWPATDIAPLPGNQACADASGNIIPANFAGALRTFTVKIKDPIPEAPGAAADAGAFNCQIKDEFHGVVVVTPIGVQPTKQAECVVKKLPQTGAGIPIAVIGLFAASSLYLFFRNRLLKRELQLVETLNEGETPNA